MTISGKESAEEYNTRLKEGHLQRKLQRKYHKEQKLDKNDKKEGNKIKNRKYQNYNNTAK